MTTNNSVAGLDLASAIQRALSARQQTLAAALPAGVGQASWYRDSLTQTLARKSTQEQSRGGTTSIGDNRRFQPLASDSPSSTARRLTAENRKGPRDEGASWIEQRKSRAEAADRGGVSSNAPSRTERGGTTIRSDRAGETTRGGDSAESISEVVAADAISEQAGEVATTVNQPIDEASSRLFPASPTTASPPAGLREFFQAANPGDAKPLPSFHRSFKEGAATPPAGLVQSLSAQISSDTIAANRLHSTSQVDQAPLDVDHSAPVAVLDEAIPTDDMADVASMLGTSGMANGVAANPLEVAVSETQLSTPPASGVAGMNVDGLNFDATSMSEPDPVATSAQPIQKPVPNEHPSTRTSSAMTDPTSATESTAHPTEALALSAVGDSASRQTLVDHNESSPKTTRANGAARDIAGRILEKQSDSVTTAGATPEQTFQNGRVGTAPFGPSLIPTSNASPLSSSWGTGARVSEATPVSPAAGAVTVTAVAAEASVETASKADLSPASGNSRMVPSDASSLISSEVARGGVRSTTRSADEASTVIRMGHAHETTERLSHAVRSAQTAGQPLRFRLHPPELGVLQVEVAFRDGRVTARLDVETEAGRQAVVDSLPALREALVASGANIERLDVQIHSTPREESPAGEDQSNREDQHADSENSKGQQKDRGDSRAHDDSPQGGRRHDRSQERAARAVKTPPASGKSSQNPSGFDQLDIQI